VLIGNSDSHIEVIAGASQALRWIAMSTEGAQAVVDADMLNSVAKLFETPRKEVQEWTSEILGELARHEPTARVAVAHVVSLLRRVSIISS
jgi:hypothetical protein